MQLASKKDSEKPNLALVTLPLPLHNKSGYVSLVKFVELLGALSNQIFIITGNFDGYTLPRKKVFVNNIDYDTRKDTMPLKMLKFFMMQIKISYNLLKMLNRQNVNVTLFFIGSSLLLPMLVAKLVRQKVVIVATGSQWKSAAAQPGVRGIVISRIMKLVEALNFFLADNISVESKNVREFLGLDRYREKTLTYLGARYTDTNCFTIKKKVGERRDLIGYVGRMSPEKGILEFVAAIPMILQEKKETEFTLVGSGPLFDRIENELKAIRSIGKVKITGWMPYDNLPDFYNEIKLLIVPSYTEGVPAVVQEAMACGAVVLATPVGGIPDLIQDERTGFILENNSPKCIVENTKRILDHSNLDEISRKAREILTKEYSYEALLNKYKIVLDYLVRPK